MKTPQKEVLGDILLKEIVLKQNTWNSISVPGVQKGNEEESLPLLSSYSSRKPGE